MTNLSNWQLKKGCDRRAKASHPWVFSNEVEAGLKGHKPGAAVELKDMNDNFVAYGYGNPISNIAFRAISFEPYAGKMEDLVFTRIMDAWRKRVRLGLKNSYRLCFSENDFLSGLVIDYYSVEQNGKTGQVLALQISSYGIEKAIKDDLKEFFKKVVETAHKEGLTKFQWSHTAVVLRNDINARKLEGLEKEEPAIIKDLTFLDLKKIDIRLTTAMDQKHLLMQTDLVGGQKTGFFLDQTRNIENLLSQLAKMHAAQPITTLKVLDLCCYVGHWSAQIAYFAKQNGIALDVTLVDISKDALTIAETNVSRHEPAQLTVKAMDVFDDLTTLTDTYDLIICDPPALIKSKKSVPRGQHAYLKLNTQCMQLLKPQALMVTCSCSGLLVKEDFLFIIGKAGRRAKRLGQIISEGGHGPDHPHLASFPEGFYLKMFILNF